MVLKTMKTKIRILPGLAACAVILFFTVSSTSAGWRIDTARFSQSIHSDLSCLDCHYDIEDLERHPDPANVRKKMSDFFHADTCLDCHEDVRGQIEEDEEHGGEAVTDADEFFNCISCHDPHYEGAPDSVDADETFEFSEGDQACLTCHRAVSPNDADAVAKNRDFCFSCHAVGKDMPAFVPVMNVDEYAQTPHASLDCMICHPAADRYEHHLQTASDCTQCHTPHEESVAHEAHAGVSCESCHLADVLPVRDRETNDILWQRTALPGTVSKLHNLQKPDGDGCVRCHFDGNSLGAAAMVLPPKSIMCMPCHTATLSATDVTTVSALAVFAVGMLGFVSLWFSGSFAGDSGTNVVGNILKAAIHAVKTLFSSKLGAILATLWYDVFLQRRLYRRSPGRWAIHALIFWPFVIRFTWAVIALVTTNWMKSWPLAWVLIDKNHPVTALVFDLTGLCLLIGIGIAFFRGFEADKTRTAGLPQQDRLALALIGGIALVGFVLEGMRIAMTGAQEPACYAFIGYYMSKLFAGMTGITDIYGYVWYLHAILTGAFVAYLPFSKMMHIIMSPVVMAMNAATKKEHH